MRLEEKPPSWKTDPEWRLTLSIDPGEFPHRLPPFRIEYASGGLMRLVTGGRPILWARPRQYWQGVWLLAPDTSRERPALPLPPLSSDTIRTIRGKPRSAAWFSQWARVFVRGLTESSSTVLHEGSWELTSGSSPGPSRPTSSRDAYGVIDLGRGPGRPGQAYESWALNGSGALVAARGSSPDDAGRVKAFRKRARDGTLPPALLLFVSGLDLWVILDGHDRLRAAAIEGVPLPWVKLCPIREVTYDPDERMRAAVLRNSNTALAQGGSEPGPALDKINERLVRAFSDARFVVSKTRAAPIPGGSERWIREVQEQLALLGPSADRAILPGS